MELTIEKLAGLMAAWHPAFQVALLLGLAALAFAFARTLVRRTFAFLDGLVELGRAFVTVPIGLFWGWPEDGNHTPRPVAVTCTCVPADSAEKADDSDDDSDDGSDDGKGTY